MEWIVDSLLSNTISTAFTMRVSVPIRVFGQEYVNLLLMGPSCNMLAQSLSRPPLPGTASQYVSILTLLGGTLARSGCQRNQDKNERGQGSGQGDA
eukprot:2681417-Pyramimonas_sp.AAC.5